MDTVSTVHPTRNTSTWARDPPSSSTPSGSTSPSPTAPTSASYPTNQPIPGQSNGTTPHSRRYRSVFLNSARPSSAKNSVTVSKSTVVPISGVAGKLQFGTIDDSNAILSPPTAQLSLTDANQTATTEPVAASPTTAKVNPPSLMDFPELTKSKLKKKIDVASLFQRRLQSDSPPPPTAPFLRTVPLPDQLSEHLEPRPQGHPYHFKPPNSHLRQGGNGTPPYNPPRSSNHSRAVSDGSTRTPTSTPGAGIQIQSPPPSKRRPIIIKTATGKVVDLHELAARTKRDEHAFSQATPKEDTTLAPRRPVSIRLETEEGRKKRVEEEEKLKKEKSKRDEDMARLKAKKEVEAMHRAKRDQEEKDRGKKVTEEAEKKETDEKERVRRKVVEAEQHEPDGIKREEEENLHAIRIETTDEVSWSEDSSINNPITNPSSGSGISDQEKESGEVKELVEQGRLHLEQGLDGSAETCWRRVLEFQERALGPHHPELEEAIYSLAEASCHLGAYNEALSYLDRLVEFRRRRLGDNHQDTAQARFLRGMALFKQEKFNEAEICWEELREQMRSAEVDDNICITIHWLGMALYQQEKFDEAEKIWLDEFHVREEWQQGSMSETLVTMRWLGEACLKQDKLSDVKLWWGKELKGWIESQEDSGMEILDAMYRLGCACYEHGELKEAEGWLEKQIAHLDDFYGNEYPHTNALDTMTYLGKIAFRQQRYNTAVYWWRREVDGRTAMFGPAEIKSIEALFWLGRAYFEGGKLAEAETQWRYAIQVRPDGEELSGDASTTQILYWLGRVCLERGEYEEAHKHWSQELKIQERMHERGSRSVLDTMSRVARACFERGWRENAVEMWKEEVELRRECHGEACKETLSAMETLSHGYSELGRYVEATEWCETSMKVRREAHGDDGVEQLGNLHLMGRIHFKEGRLEDAERFWGEELKKREEVHPEHRWVARVLYKRSKLYLQTNRVSKAEVDIRRALELQSKYPGANDPTLQECQTLLDSINALGSVNDISSSATSGHVEDSSQAGGYVLDDPPISHELSSSSARNPSTHLSNTSLPINDIAHIDEPTRVVGCLDASTSREPSSQNVVYFPTSTSTPSLSASPTDTVCRTSISDSFSFDMPLDLPLTIQSPLPASFYHFQKSGKRVAASILFVLSTCILFLALSGSLYVLVAVKRYLYL